MNRPAGTNQETMFDRQFDIAGMIAARQKGEMNAEAEELLNKWIAEDPANQALFNRLNDEVVLQEKLAGFRAINEAAGWIKVTDGINSGINPGTGFIAAEDQVSVSPGRTVKLWKRISVAAAAAVVIIVGSYLYKSKLQLQDNQQNEFVNDVAPGTAGATLTLANGKKIRLNTAVNGELAKEAGVSITKTAAGELIYEIKETNKSSQSINSLSTAKGETYQVVLPDGSKVWLNAASKLEYPARFAANEKRRVSLEGEAYFEIAKDKTRPFIVETAREDVEVLGTHFNVNSYADEQITKTTLLEGSVRVSLASGNDSGTGKGLIRETVLKPGEQASLDNGGKLNVTQANLRLAVAWKNGKFQFDNQRIEDIMQMLARWYNVEVVYQKGAGDQPFTGSISRSENISKILDKITYTQNIHFKIEGRRVTVMP